MLKYHLQTIEVDSSGAGSIVFNNIPQDYDDLFVVISGRSSYTSGNVVAEIDLTLNGSTSGFTNKRLYGRDAGVATDALTRSLGQIPNNSATSAIFSSTSLHILNYTSSRPKTYSIDYASENVGSQAYSGIIYGLWSGTSAISSLGLTPPDGPFMQYSSASLYGIKRGSSGKVEVASGGVITQSGGYTIHTFTSSGTFVANRDLQAEVLVVGGGGPGGYNYGGGGGAGGVLYAASTFLNAGSNHSIVIGAGGSRGINTLGSNGTPSSFSSFTAIGGGAAGYWNSSNFAASAGGSGGGGGMGTSDGQIGLGAASTQTSAGDFVGYGNAGGNGYRNSGGIYKGGGGGGASTAGVSAPTDNTSPAGNGGDGIGLLVSGTLSYYAGGGGGSGETVNAGDGGIGGGGQGAKYLSRGSTAGAANTGGGGGGGLGNSSYYPSNGGSGVVIIRYPTPA